MKKTVFEKPFTTFAEADVKSAFRYSEELLRAAKERAYAQCPPDALAEFLIGALELADGHGALSLLPGVSMPSDARVELIRIPGYVVCAAGIYLLNTHPELLPQRTVAQLKRLTDDAFAGGIAGHGYDAFGTAQDVMLILALADAGALIRRDPLFSKNLTDTADAVLRQFAGAACQRDPSGKRYTKTPFDSALCNAQLKRILAAWHGNTEPVFVYGTLMEGQRAHGKMGNADYCGRFLLKGHAMLDLGSYPGIIPSENAEVVGEVYFVSEAALREMDRYEDEGRLYHRRSVSVCSAYGKLEVWAYLYALPCTEKEHRGMWNMDSRHDVWYAAYGSNLSADRFKYYLRGGKLPQNKTAYPGCSDRSLWKDSRTAVFPGALYFGNRSPSWYGAGVAFYDPHGEDTVLMRLYKITGEQLLEVQTQESTTLSPNWYGRLLCLGIAEDGCPIYTFTSACRRPENAPSEAYIALIRHALTEAFGMSEPQARRYLKEQT